MSKYKLVPVEPTQEMIDAGRTARTHPAERYKAMLAAAPEVEQEPAAWRVDWREKSPERIPVFFDRRQDAMDYCGSDDWLVEPLYLHPQPAPEVRGEPVGWSGWACQYPERIPRLYGEREIAELNCDLAGGDQLIYLSAAPQPAPDTALLEAFDAGRRAAQAEAAELVDALKAMIEQAQRVSVCGNFSSDVVLRAIDALAAYRQQEGEA